MKNKRSALFKEYRNYDNLLHFREKCNKDANCTGWDTAVSNYVKKTFPNVDETIDGKTIQILKDKIMSDIAKLWNISAYLGIMKGDVVNITNEPRSDTPLRSAAFMLKKFNKPVSTDKSVVNDDPLKILVETVAPDSDNKILNIAKEYAISVIIIALGGLVAYYMKLGDDSGGDLHGGGEDEDAEELLKQLKTAETSRINILNYVNNNLTDEQKNKIKKEVEKIIGKKVSTEDFAEFGLGPNENIFGFMNTGSRGGKRKRNTKRGTKKNKKNKKSNRKRRA
jgi:hypothetical protein